MNNYTRLVLASLSALLLAAGLSRAAEKLDPISNGSTHDLKLDEDTIKTANSCLPCVPCYDDEGGGDGTGETGEGDGGGS